VCLQTNHNNSIAILRVRTAPTIQAHQKNTTRGLLILQKKFNNNRRTPHYKNPNALYNFYRICTIAGVHNRTVIITAFVLFLFVSSRKKKIKTKRLTAHEINPKKRKNHKPTVTTVQSSQTIRSCVVGYLVADQNGPRDMSHYFFRLRTPERERRRRTVSGARSLKFDNKKRVLHNNPGCYTICVIRLIVRIGTIRGEVVADYANVDRNREKNGHCVGAESVTLNWVSFGRSTKVRDGRKRAWKLWCRGIQAAGVF
jgi:hypothetical protein